MTDEKRAYNKEYDRQNTKMYCFKLNYRTDADLISWMDTCSNVQGMIKRLLNEELERITQGRL